MTVYLSPVELEGVAIDEPVQPTKPSSYCPPRFESMRSSYREKRMSSHPKLLKCV